MALGAALAAACDVPISAQPSGPWPIASEPADGEPGVDRAATLRVIFDRRVLPREADRSHVRLTSGARSAFLLVHADPFDSSLHVRPSSALDPEVQWHLRIEGIRDLDGVAMQEPWETFFVTGTEAAGDPPPPPTSFADVAPIFARCSSADCHGGESPVLGLDLSSPDGVRTTAIGVPARLSMAGAQAVGASGRLGLVDLPRIDVTAGVGQAASSFLVYKVLGEPHASGERMPPPPAEPLSERELSTLANWIAAGAPTD